MYLLVVPGFGSHYVHLADSSKYWLLLIIEKGSTNRSTICYPHTSYIFQLDWTYLTWNFTMWTIATSRKYNTPSSWTEKAEEFLESSPQFWICINNKDNSDRLLLCNVRWDSCRVSQRLMKFGKWKECSTAVMTSYLCLTCWNFKNLLSFY